MPLKSWMELICTEGESSCLKISHAGEAVVQDRGPVPGQDEAPSRGVEASHVHALDHLGLNPDPSLEIVLNLQLQETTTKTIASLVHAAEASLQLLRDLALDLPVVREITGQSHDLDHTHDQDLLHLTRRTMTDHHLMIVQWMGNRLKCL